MNRRRSKRAFTHPIAVTVGLPQLDIYIGPLHLVLQIDNFHLHRRVAITCQHYRSTSGRNGLHYLRLRLPPYPHPAPNHPHLFESSIQEPPIELSPTSVQIR
jgi:hypothetical protein